MTPTPTSRRSVRQVLAAARRRVGLELAPETVARLEGRIETLETQLRTQTRLHYTMAPTPAAGRGRASWQAYVRRTRRLYGQIAKLPDRDVVPHWRLPRKLDNYRLAASHGIRVPTVYAVWDRIDDIRLAGLPDRFVLKSDGGSTSRGVFPVRRDGVGFVQVDGRRRFGPTGLHEALRDLEQDGLARPPYFAEELLQDRTAGPLPHDVKLYCFYGEVGQVLVRQVPEHGEDRSLRKRYVRPDGTDLTDEVPEPQDATIPLPPHFEEALRVGVVLSHAVPLPFVRVDVYDTPDGVVLGEITLVPGGRNAWSLEHDTHLGQLVEAAEARLWRDLARGRPCRALYGEEHPPTLEPASAGPGGEG